MIQKFLIALCLTCLTHPALAGARGFLGLEFGNIPKTEIKVRPGVIVKAVFPGMVGQQIGLKAGEIVTQINGVAVPDPKTAVALLAENAAGERIWLTVIDRTGGNLRPSNVFVTMGAIPTREFARIMTAKPLQPPRRLSHSSKESHCVGAVRAGIQPCDPNSAAEDGRPPIH